MKETKLIAIAMGLVFVGIDFCFIGIMFSIPQHFGILEKILGVVALLSVLTGANIGMWIILRHMWKDF